MEKRKKGSTIYYSDLLNDDFGEIGLERMEVPSNYKYKRTNPINNFFSNILYYVIAMPILKLVCFFSGVKVKNRKSLKLLKKSGAFIYANHTNFLDMIQYQTIVTGYMKRVNIIGYSDTLSIPIVKHLARALGYIPIPTDFKGQAKFMDALKFYIDKNQFIVIFPEAHIWQYYTEIRPFTSASFHYPAKFMAPIIPIVTVFRRGIFKNSKPKETLVIGDPIFPNSEFNLKENKEFLREECYKQMVSISSKYEQYKYFNYIYKEKN